MLDTSGHELLEAHLAFVRTHLALLADARAAEPLQLQRLLVSTELEVRRALQATAGLSRLVARARLSELELALFLFVLAPELDAEASRLCARLAPEGGGRPTVSLLEALMHGVPRQALFEQLARGARLQRLGLVELAADGSRPWPMQVPRCPLRVVDYVLRSAPAALDGETPAWTRVLPTASPPGWVGLSDTPEEWLEAELRAGKVAVFDRVADSMLPAFGRIARKHALAGLVVDLAGAFASADPAAALAPWVRETLLRPTLSVLVGHPKRPDWWERLAGSLDEAWGPIALVHRYRSPVENALCDIFAGAV